MEKAATLYDAGNDKAAGQAATMAKYAARRPVSARLTRPSERSAAAR
jgi:hypothetical protein